MRHVAVLLIPVFLLISLASCVRSPDASVRTPVTASASKLRISPHELRIRVRAQIRPVVGLLEEGVDDTLADSTAAATRRHGLILKIEGTSTLLSAMLRDDPLLALADAWGYVMQLQDFYAEPEIRETYGEFADDAGEILERIERSLFGFAVGVQTDLPVNDFESRLHVWAAANPIEGSVRRRPSMDEELAELLAVSPKRGALAAIGSLEETTAELMTRMEMYTNYFPRLARWEAELALLDLAGDVDLRDVASDLDHIRSAAERIAGAGEGLSGIAADERSAALAALHEERLEATADLRAGREAILDAIRVERVATLLEIERVAERLLDRSGATVRAAAVAETDRLVERVEEMRARLIEDAGDVLNQVVDRAFWRALQSLLIAAALLAVGVVLHARFLRPKGGAASPDSS